MLCAPAATRCIRTPPLRVQQRRSNHPLVLVSAALRRDAISPLRLKSPAPMLATRGAAPPPSPALPVSLEGEGGPESLSPWPVVVGLCALGIALSYADRSNMSVAVLSMAPEFAWSKTFEGVVLASFFLGYACTQLVGGQLADALGGKPVLAAGLGFWSLATFATPAAAHSGAAPLLLARVALGLGEGVAFPAVHSLISRTVPKARQSTAVALVTGASYLGAALAFLLVPPLIQARGWSASFECFGALALLWLPCWLPLRVAAPALPAPRSRLGLRAAAAAAARELAPLLRRREVLAICGAQYCGSWGLYGLISWLPTFYSDQYGVPLSDLPQLTFAPYLLQAGVGVAAGFLADRLIAGGAPRLQVRKRLQLAGMLLPAAALLAAASPLAAGSPSLGAALIDLGLAGSALSLGGVSANHLDIAPRHAGAVFGAGNTAATLAGLASVPVTGALLDASGSWALVFGVTAAHYVLGAVLFAAWAGAEPLPEDGA